MNNKELQTMEPVSRRHLAIMAAVIVITILHAWLG